MGWSSDPIPGKDYEAAESFGVWGQIQYKNMVFQKLILSQADLPNLSSIYIYIQFCLRESLFASLRHGEVLRFLLLATPNPLREPDEPEAYPNEAFEAPPKSVVKAFVS